MRERSATRRAPIALSAAMCLAAIGLEPSAAEAQQDRMLPWRLEKRWEAGRAASDSLEFTSLRVGNIAADHAGRLYVLDPVRLTIAVLDSSGRYTGTFGRRGNGPGEFASAGSISVSRDGLIVVYDAENLRWAAFDHRGAVVPVPRLPAGVMAQEPRVIDGTKVVALIPRRDTARLELLEGNQRRRLATMAVAPSHSTPPVCSITDYLSPPVFSPQLLFAVHGTRVATTQGPFAVTVYDGPRTWRMGRPDAVRRRAGLAEARRQLGEGTTLRFAGMPPCTVPAEMILRASGVASEMPAYSSITLAPDGRVWATRFSLPRERRLADIYDVRTGYVGTVSIGHTNPVAFLANGDLISAEMSEDDVPYLASFRVRVK